MSHSSVGHFWQDIFKGKMSKSQWNICKNNANLSTKWKFYDQQQVLFFESIPFYAILFKNHESIEKFMNLVKVKHSFKEAKTSCEVAKSS